MKKFLISILCLFLMSVLSHAMTNNFDIIKNGTMTSTGTVTAADFNKTSDSNWSVGTSATTNTYLIIWNGIILTNGATIVGLNVGASTTPIAVGSIGGSNVLDFATGAYQSALVTNALVLMPPANGTHGARLEVWLKASGAARTLDFGSSIVKPSDSAASFPKTLTSNLTYIVLLRNSSNIWWLTSLVGGF